MSKEKGEWEEATIMSVLQEEFSGEWGAEPESSAINTRVLRSTNLDDDGHIDYSTAAERNISLQLLKQKQMMQGDILLEVSGGGPGKPVGRVAVFEDYDDATYVCSNFFRTLRPSAKVVPRFLLWRLLLLYSEPRIWSFQRQTTGIINLKVSEYLNQELLWPPPCEQQRRADIIDIIDAQIQYTERLIAKLQCKKMGLMYNLLTRGLDEYGHLRDYHVHSEKFKVSDLGQIPEEWEIVTVEDIGSVMLGRQRAPQHQSGLFTTPYLRVANVFDGWIDYSDVLQMDFTPDARKIFTLVPGDILLNEGQSLELVGRSAIYTGPTDTYCFQNTLIRFRCNEERAVPEFCQYLFKYWLDSGKFALVAKQTTSVAHLGADRFAKMVLPLPHKDEQRRIAAMLGALDSDIRAEELDRDKLKLQKRGLMQDLLLGDVYMNARG